VVSASLLSSANSPISPTHLSPVLTLFP
jgi:hypothetical protein